MRIYVAIDDTDNEESIGTGKLARMLGAELEENDYVRASSVTRHQLLVHPDIPFTSHNSCACIEGEAQATGISEIASFAIKFLIRNFHEGADPGICVASEETVSDRLVDFGLRAQREIIFPDQARELAECSQVITWWRGEPWRGCIGALSGVGLRSTGNDGRFIGLKGIREIGGIVSVGELLARTGIDEVATVSGRALTQEEMIDTGEWIRPSLRNCKNVLFVEPKERAVWSPIQEKKRSE